MTAPKFSIVIPTRERAETLCFSLRTCLQQDFGDYEVVVCDNFSSPATREVVEAGGSARVRYVRAPRPLSMTANWELAVSQARGEYVLVLGDDDGLLPFALRELDRLLTHAPTKVLRWSAAYYTWPNFPFPEDANYLRLPLGRELQARDFRSAVASVVRGEACYSTLPMLYNSAVHRSVLEELRRRTGRVFLGPYPDVYSGFAVAAVAGSYLSLGAPFSIAGSSGKSYGMATLFLRGKSPLDRDYRELNARDHLPHHPWVADLPVFPEVPVADSFLRAKEALFPDEAVQIDRRTLLVRCVEYLRVDSEEEWLAALRELRETLLDDVELLSWFDANLADKPLSPPPRPRFRSEHLGPDGQSLHLDVCPFEVRDVAGAARLCGNLLGVQNGPLRVEEKPPPPALGAGSGALPPEGPGHLDRPRQGRLVGFAKAVLGRLARIAWPFSLRGPLLPSDPAEVCYRHFSAERLASPEAVRFQLARSREELRAKERCIEGLRDGVLQRCWRRLPLALKRRPPATEANEPSPDTRGGASTVEALRRELGRTLLQLEEREAQIQRLLRKRDRRRTEATA